MATLPELEKALMAADKAGNAEDASMLANEIVRMRGQPAPQPSLGEVAVNAAAKGAAAIPDSVLNAPAHLFNLGKAAYGAAAYALGYKEIGDAVSMTAPPSPVRAGMEQAGMISESREPQTGLQRVADLAVQGGIGVAIAPASGLKEVGKNIALGATSGAAAGVTKEVTGSPWASIAVGVLTPIAARHALNGLGKQANNEVLGETVRDGLDAGYVLPPSSIRPTFIGNKVESVAGKAAVKQEASMRNQEVTNALATKALNLPEGTPLTESTLATVREKAGQAYEAVAKIPVNQAVLPTPKNPAAMLAELREARSQAQIMFKGYDRTGQPALLEEAKKFSATAAKLEQGLEQVARQAGQPELVQAMKDARTQIAKTYDVERALNVGDGNVDARVIGRLLDQGRPLTGELKTIGRFTQAFPQVTREAAVVPAPGVSGTDAAASALLGTVGYGAAGGPAGLVAAGLPLLRGPARSLTLSGMMQRRLLREPPTLYSSFLRGSLAGRAIADEVRD